MSEARFGEHFPSAEERGQNWLDVRRQTQELPESVQVSRQIREALNATIEESGWPEVPQHIASAEDLFSSAHAVVTERWKAVAVGLIQEHVASWVEQMQGNPEAAEMASLLQNPNELEVQMRIRQFGALEDLRLVVPEAWRALVLASSERQLAAVATVREWLKQLPAEKVAETGMSKTELELFTDISAVLGKYLDHAYAKQIILADLPGGSTKTKMNDQEGADYLYDIYPTAESDDIEVLTYTQVFPFEWPKLKTRLEAVSKKTEKLLAQGDLPESYRNLPAFLHHVSEAYGSDSVTPSQLYNQWKELMIEMRNLAIEGCPIMLVPQACPSVAGKAAKVDVEMRLGLRSPEVVEMEHEYEAIRQQSVELNKEYSSALEKAVEVPALILNSQPLAHGPNLYWMTRGEADSDRIISHTNAVREVAMAKEMPLASKVLGNILIDETAYALAAAGETITHEFGHTVLPMGDKRVRERIGSGGNQAVIEEIKAVAGSMTLIDRAIKNNTLPDAIDPKMQLVAKIGTVANYFVSKSSEVNSSGERYYYAGVAVFDRLLSKGLLKPDNGVYKLGPIKKCIEAIGEVGREVMDLYANTETTPEKVAEFVQALRARNNSPEMQALVALIKS